MIKTFKTDRNTLFFPTSWANAVARWIIGLMSKEGTIKITNTPNPSDEGGCSIDVNMDAVYDEIKRRLAEDTKKKSEDETIDQNVEEENGSGTGNGKYGVRFGFADVMDNIYPTTISWMAVGTEENLMTYTGETTWNGYTVGVFSCNTAENNYPVKVIPGALITGALSVKPRFAGMGDNRYICALDFGTMRDLVLNVEENVKTLDIDAVGKYCVKPTFNASNVLTALSFGSASQLDATSDTNINTVETQIGCPYNS